MKSYWPHNEAAARFVEGLLEHLKIDSPVTMIITPEKSGEFSVQIVTVTLSEDIDEKALNFYKPHLPTSTVNTQAGWFHLNQRRERKRDGRRQPSPSKVARWLW